MLNRLFSHKFHYYMAFKIKNMLWDLYVVLLQTTYSIYERFDWFDHNSFEFLYHGSLQLLYHWQCLGRIETFYQQQINAWSRKQKNPRQGRRLSVNSHWHWLVKITCQWPLINDNDCSMIIGFITLIPSQIFFFTCLL